jgi:hypothetical protein
MTPSPRSTTVFTLAAGCLLLSIPSANGLTIQWQRVLATNTRDFARGVSVDGVGGVYVAGQTDASLAGPHEGFTDGFVSRYGPTGQLQWSRQIGTNKSDVVTGVAADSNGSVYVSGATGGTIGGTNAGGTDAFIRKYSSSGTPSWTRQFGTSHTDTALGVAADEFGNVFVAGSTFGNLGGEFNSAKSDAFLAKYNSEGTLLWTRLTGTAQDEIGASVATDALGNVYLAGMTSGDLAGSSGTDDAFIRKYDASGAHVWTRQLGTSQGDRALGVSTDHLGNVFLCGYTQGDIGSPDESQGVQDSFICKFEDDGDLIWTRQFGGYNDDDAASVFADGTGGAYVTGTITFETGPSTGSRDVIVKRFDSEGGHVWSLQLGTSASDYGLAISADRNGGVFVAGEFSPGNAFLTKLSEIPGDYNGDGAVDGADFLTWQRAYGTLTPPRQSPDGDGNGEIGAGDLVIWRNAMGQVVPTNAAASRVPEPAVAGTLGAAIVLLLNYRRRNFRD